MNKANCRSDSRENALWTLRFSITKRFRTVEGERETGCVKIYCVLHLGYLQGQIALRDIIECSIFLTFRPSTFFSHLSLIDSLIIYCLSQAFHRPMLRSHHSQVIYMVAVTNITVVKIWLMEKKSWQELRACSSTTSQHGNTGYAASYGLMVCRYWNVQCDGPHMGNEDDAFLPVLCKHAVTISLTEQIFVSCTQGLRHPYSIHYY